MNLRPPGYEPDELPGCSTPRRYSCFQSFWWRGLDLNQRRRLPADLQSVPFGHLGTSPRNANVILLSTGSLCKSFFSRAGLLAGWPELPTSSAASPIIPACGTECNLGYGFRSREKPHVTLPARLGSCPRSQAGRKGRGLSRSARSRAF